MFSQRVILAEVFVLCIVSQLMFFTVKQSLLQGSKDPSAFFVGSNIQLWHIEVELRKGNEKCKPILAVGHETKHQNEAECGEEAGGGLVGERGWGGGGGG